MNAPPQKRAGREHHTLRTEAPALDSLDSGNPVPVQEQPGNRSLNRAEAAMLLEQGAHRAAVQSPVTLRPWSPDGGTLATIQHAKLDHRQVGGASHDAAHRIHFAHHRTLGYAADRGVARHLADGLEGAGDDRDRTSESRGGDRRLGTGMTCANDDHVEGRLEVATCVAADHLRKVA